MSDKLITVSFPQGDSVAAHHFGEALIRMSAAMEGRNYPVLGEEAPEPKEQVVHVQTPPVVQHVPVTAQVVDNVPPPPPVAAPTEYAPGENIYMIAPDEQNMRLVNKFAERDELLEQGYRIVSREEMEEWEPRELSDTDSEGLPWDERIHSGSKGKVKDGTWRLRKTPTDQTAEQWQQYVADIKASLKEPAVAEQGDDFNTDTGTVTEETVAGIPPIAPPAIPVPPVVDAPANLPPPAEYNGPKTFPELMAAIMENMEAVTPHMQILCSRAKIGKVNELHTNEAAIPAFYQDMVNTCGL